jgi:hypothetical protein
MKGRKYKLPAHEVEQLLQLAVHSSSSGSMVRALLLLPGAAYLPGGGLQLVMEQCRRQGQQAGSTATNWLWPPQQQQAGAQSASCSRCQGDSQSICGSSSSRCWLRSSCKRYSLVRILTSMLVQCFRQLMQPSATLR